MKLRKSDQSSAAFAFDKCSSYLLAKRFRAPVKSQVQSRNQLTRPSLLFCRQSLLGVWLTTLKLRRLCDKYSTVDQLLSLYITHAILSSTFKYNPLFRCQAPLRNIALLHYTAPHLWYAGLSFSHGIFPTTLIKRKRLENHLVPLLLRPTCVSVSQDAGAPR
ncbi:hypothetical protein IF1G_07762 [Cordyceps javanica]|uniref:Uncharacterized protein n=1 Tax=Cordyceps javanica TaxID=43265 RepID=A0A545UUP5_9HYPO|nr:hypothetical protein IF1G_07762 [Cordyceps javanica]TQW05452.1 hypothetical protein IF2G_07389 [Cordyceps javanica]